MRLDLEYREHNVPETACVIFIYAGSVFGIFNYNKQTLPPVVDIEFYGDKKRNLPEKEYVKRELQELLDALENRYGERSIIYSTEKSYLLYIINEFEDYHIWTPNIVTDPYVSDWKFW